MNWYLYRWIWRLESPLFVGMPPAGSLNRCRLYLPARAMHGATTAELARRPHCEGKSGNNEGPDYGKFGKEIGENCRFTYFYPAKKKDDNFWVYLPQYITAEEAKQNSKLETANGLQWVCRDEQGNQEKPLAEREFKSLLLASLASTAIDSITDCAEEATLRERECLNPFWRKQSEDEEIKEVYLLGYVFLKRNGFSKKLPELETLFVGGDTRYGLGKMCCEAWQDMPATNPLVFGKSVSLVGEHPTIRSKIVWGHAHPCGAGESCMRGAREVLGGWDIDVLREDSPSWAPGSFLEREKSEAGQDKEEANWLIDTYGKWIGAKEGICC